MPLIRRGESLLVIVDVQQRLMPAIAEGEAVLASALTLARAATQLQVPILRTEQYPKGLGPTVAPLHNYGPVIEKITFDACGAEAFLPHLPNQATLVVTGCEAHVCVLQTVLGLLHLGRNVAVVADAVGSRHPDNKARALDRMAAHGADIVTTEMVVFEWLGRADSSDFKPVLTLIR